MKKIVYAMVLMLVLGTVVGCSQKKDNTSAGTGVIKIGVIAPLTGSYQMEGQAQVNAVKMAVDEVNKAGGVLGGKQVEVVAEDGMGKPAESISAAEKLITDDKVVAIQGAQLSTPTKAVMPTLEKYGILMVTAISTAPDITEGNLPGKQWIFRVIPHDGLVADAIVKFMMNDLHAKKVAMLASNDDWGRQSTQLIVNNLTKSGGQAVATEYYTTGETNFLPQLTRIKDKSPDVLFLVGQSQDGSMMAKQVKEIGFNKPVLGLGAFASSTFVNLAKDAAEGIYSASQYVDSIDSSDNKDLIAKYKALYPNMPTPDKYVWGPYTAAKAILEAINKAGSADPAKIAEAMKKVDFNGITGEIAFDEKHQAHPNVYITVIKDGKPQILKTIPTK